MSYANRSCRVEDERRRHMKNPEGGHAEDAAALLGREALPGQLSDDGQVSLGAPLLK
jgi:hypothetical protein